MTLNLAYDASVPAELLREVERLARCRGMPLDELERIGQSAERCRAFLRSARRDGAAVVLVRPLRDAASHPAPARWPPRATV